jgi:hypothetical protein
VAKFNTVDNRKVNVAGPVAIDRTVTNARTHEGAPAFVRDSRSELFMLGVTNMVGEDTFYEKAGTRDARFSALVREVATTFEPDWMVGFVGWLRREVGLRSAPLVAACEAVHARLASGLAGDNRAMVNAAISRADEPGELVAYWRANFGGTLPMAVKRGLSDAVNRVYTEFSALKYDTPERAYRFGDVIALVRPTPATAEKRELFEHLLARSRGRDELFRGAGLPMLRARVALGQVDPAARRLMLAGPPGRRLMLADSWEMFRAAGMTWEAVPAWLDAGGNGAMDKAAWEAIIPHMGVFAMARNLRNFDQAGVSDKVAKQIMRKFEDAELVAKAGIFPYQWLSAYENAPSVRWSYPLDQALNAAVRCVPELDGDTEILVDTSASMVRAQYSAMSKMAPVKNAAIFGAALALRNPRARLLGFASGVFEHKVPPGESLVKVVTAFTNRVGEVGHGTDIVNSVRKALRAGTRRVFVISDMQTQDGSAGYGLGDVVPSNVALYGVNLGGYRPTVVPAGDKARFEFPALSDKMFKMVPLLESGRSASWPWL